MSKAKYIAGMVNSSGDVTNTSLTNSLDLKAPLASPTFTGTVSGITKSMVGLGNVDNTTDLLKPISTATQTALDLKSPLTSPTFTGTVSGITKSMVGLGDVANTAQVTSVSGTAPIVSSGGLTPEISISAATISVAGSMSSADKTKLDAITGTHTGNNTGDQTLPVASSTAPAALGVAAVGTGTTFARADHVHLLPTLGTLGAQAAGTYATGTGSASGTNTGDETLATIKTKLGVTTLSGSNTGDQTTVSGSSGSCTGNAATATTAATATKLQTSRSINGTSFDGSADITSTEWFHSNRDFINGTLITTSIDYSVVDGDPFVLQIRGNNYGGGGSPMDIQIQGYIYGSTIINYTGYSISPAFTITAMRIGNNLCFWFARQGYWQGYNVHAYTAYGPKSLNKVTAITDVVNPNGTKQVAITPKQVLRSDNYTSYSPSLTGYGASGSWGIKINDRTGGGYTHENCSGFITTDVNNNGLQVRMRETNSAAYAAVLFTSTIGETVLGGTIVGSINCSRTATAYNTPSDYRLKSNQAILTGHSEFIDKLQPKTWIWKNTGEVGVGLIAHEFAEVSPSSVTGEKDAIDEKGDPIYQVVQVSSSEVMANIIAELQDLRKRVALLGG